MFGPAWSLWRVIRTRLIFFFVLVLVIFMLSMAWSSWRIRGSLFIFFVFIFVFVFLFLPLGADNAEASLHCHDLLPFVIWRPKFLSCVLVGVEGLC